MYKGDVHYANDAFDGLRFMELTKSGAVSVLGTKARGKDEREVVLTGAEAKIALATAEQVDGRPSRSKIRTDVPTPEPPFWGSRVVTDVSLDDVFRYINETALFRGQWRVVRGTTTDEEFKQVLEEQVYPDFQKLKEKIKNEKLLDPKVVYGYFPCQSEGNDLIVYHLPKGDNTSSSKFGVRRSNLREWLRFSFPRQSSDRHLCITDFFASIESEKVDVLACHVVTVGRKASEYSQRLYAANKYKDYLYFHGLSVESAEALAEFWHKRIREELGIAGKDAADIRRLFSQGYQGSRYSFGYPACPNLEDQTKLFELLRPDRIEVTLTDQYQMEPEQSTSAIIVHHPEARYFNVK
jgi:5-methyltetrahydrofolate--homocysteine methyltransferase